MKKLLFISLLILVFGGCIKKKALKADPGLVGTWVSKGTYYTWLIISPDGHGVYRTFIDQYEDYIFKGEVKYSLFESKLFVGKTKFKVINHITGNTNGVTNVDALDYTTLTPVNYKVDLRMTLKTSIWHANREIDFYRVAK